MGQMTSMENIFPAHSTGCDNFSTPRPTHILTGAQGVIFFTGKMGDRLFDISSFGGQTWTSMIKPQILDIWLLIRLVLVMEIDEGDLTDTIPFYRMKIGPLFMQWHPFAC